MPGGAHTVEVEMRGLVTTTAAMGGTAPESIRNTISASAMEVPKLGERIAITIILGDGSNAIALLDDDVFQQFATQLMHAGEQCALMAAKPNGKAN